MTVIPVKKIFFKSCRKRQQTFSATGRLDFISSIARCLLLLLACLSLTKVSCVSSSSTSTVRSNVIATNLTNVSSSNFNASSSSRSPSSPAAQVHPIQALTKNNNNNNYQNNNDNVLMNNVNSFGSFERTLSPRQIKTKYGFLRGILISLPSTSSSLSASKSSPTSRPATVSINLVSSSHSNLSSVSSSRSSSNDSNSLTAVEAFLGVPYASPPLGSLRFMPPVTPSHWRGVRMANSLGASCPQRVPKHVKDLSKGREDYLKRLKPFLDNTSEDCLYLNVYLPYDRDSTEKLAVMFFVTGESYDWGSGSALDGTVLSSISRTIIITLNYRLGLLGFLPTTIEGSRRGNYALMDIIAGLHWVHDNVGELGGDSSNITVVGHGSGASLANLLMMSPMARGLFNRVILMSGSALGPSSIARDSDFFTQSLAKAVNCESSSSSPSSSQDHHLLTPSSSQASSSQPSSSSSSQQQQQQQILECLRTKSVDELNKVNYGIDDSFRVTFGPIVDGLLIPQDPLLLMESENSSSHHLSYLHPMGLRSMMPGSSKPPHSLMMGVTSMESPFIFTDIEEKTGIDGLRRDRILYSFIKNIIDYYQEVILLSVVNEYTDWLTESPETPIKRLDSLMDILSDGLIVSPLLRAGSLHQRHQTRRTVENNMMSSNKKQSLISSTADFNPKTFFYVFNHSSRSSKYDARLHGVHGEELAYLFGAPIAVSLGVTAFGSFSMSNYTTSEMLLSREVINYFSNFAKFGNPNTFPVDSGSKNGKKSVKPSHSSNIQTVLWPEYEESGKKYLSIGVPSTVNDHYKSHRMSFWQNLIPKLQIHGREESESFKRHLQDQSRSGIVNTNPSEVAFFERISLKFLDNLKPPPDPSSDSMRTSSLHDPSNPSSIVNSMTNKNPGQQESTNQHHTSNVVNPVKGKTTIRISEPESDAHYLTYAVMCGAALIIVNMMLFLIMYVKMNKYKHGNNSGHRRQSHDQQSPVRGKRSSSMSCSQAAYSSVGRHDPCSINSNSLNRRSVPSNSLRRTSQGSNSNTMPRLQQQSTQVSSTSQAINPIQHTSPAHLIHGSHHGSHSHGQSTSMAHHQQHVSHVVPHHAMSTASNTYGQRSSHEEQDALLSVQQQQHLNNYLHHHQLNYGNNEVTSMNSNTSYDSSSSNTVAVDNTFNPETAVQQSYQQHGNYDGHQHHSHHHHHPHTVTFNDYITHVPPTSHSQVSSTNTPSNNLVVKYSNSGNQDVDIMSIMMTNGHHHHHHLMNGGSSSEDCLQVLPSSQQIPDLYGSPSHVAAVTGSSVNSCDHKQMSQQQQQQQQLTVIQEIQGEDDHLC